MVAPHGRLTVSIKHTVRHAPLPKIDVLVLVPQGEADRSLFTRSACVHGIASG
jgi:hypothetical protein